MKQLISHSLQKAFFPLCHKNLFHQRVFPASIINLCLVFLFVSPALFSQASFSVRTDPVVPSGLAVYYPFNGNANDSSGNGHNATVVNATLTTNRFGAGLSAYSFNGTTSTIQYGDILDEIFCAPVAKFSIVGWAKTRTFGSFSGGGGFIIGKNGGGSFGPYQWNVTHADGLLYGAVFSDTLAHNYIALTSPVSTNQWFQFVLMFDGSVPETQRVKLFVNRKSSGVSVYQDVGTLGTTTVNSKQHLTLGASHDSNFPQSLSSFYNGDIDDIRIYNRILSTAEIDSLYHVEGWNYPPVANAGADQTVGIGLPVTLVGSASSDPDGDTLAYTWKEGTTVLGTTAQLAVALPLGVHTITLTVADSYGGTSTDDVVVTIVEMSAYYPFNGNANDESGNAGNGIVYGATLTKDRFGNNNSAYHFTGGANIRIPELFPDSCPAFTFTAWAKKDAADNGRHVIIYKGIQKGEASIIITPGVLGFGVNLHVPGTPTDTQNWYAANTTDSLKAHKYYFIAGRYKKGEKVDLWINGTEVSSTAIPDLKLVSDPLRTSSAIGNHTEPGHSVTDWWNGVLDDIRVYNRALSPEEIDSLYHEGGWTTPSNYSPIAEAGPDQTIAADSTGSAEVTLDGSASLDPDGDSLTYLWRENTDTLGIGTAAQITVTMPVGIHTVMLTVDDGKGGTSNDSVMIGVVHLPNGLVAYYPFNGNANDSSGNGQNATVVKANLTTDRFGADSCAYSFNSVFSTKNTIQYGDILDEIFCAPVAKFSIVGWAKTRVYGSFSGGGGFIIGKNAGGGGPYQWNVTHADGLLYGAVFSDTLAQNYIALTSPMPTNQWFQFVLMFDGSLPETQRVQLFVNGKSSGTSVYQDKGALGTTTVNSKQHLTLGGTHDKNSPQSLSSFYNGDIDDIRIYDRILSTVEIDSLYHVGGWAIPPNQPVAYYPFNGNANDESSNHHHGTVIGATLTKDRFEADSSAMSFDGMNDIINIGDKLDEIFCDSIARFTVSAWARADVVSGPLPIVTKSAGGLGPYQWTVGINMFGSTGFATGEIYSDTVAHNYIQLRRPVVADQWYYFVLVFDGSLPENNRVKFYVNGQTDSVYVHIKVGTVSTATVNSQQYITIGGTHDPGNTETVASPYSGVIDEVRIYNRPLSSAEIDSLYHEGGWAAQPPASASLSRLGLGIPGSIQLYNNFPNPFNPSTDIRFAVPHEEFVSLKVYDMLGREVATLVSEHLTPETYNVHFDASGRSSGVYFYRLRVGSTVQTKRMMLMK